MKIAEEEFLHGDSAPFSYIYELVQERCNSIGNAQELHLSCTNPQYEVFMKLAEEKFLHDDVPFSHMFHTAASFQWPLQGLSTCHWTMDWTHSGCHIGGLQASIGNLMLFCTKLSYVV